MGMKSEEINNFVFGVFEESGLVEEAKKHDFSRKLLRAMDMISGWLAEDEFEEGIRRFEEVVLSGKLG